MRANNPKSTKPFALGCLGLLGLFLALGALAERNQNHWRPLHPSTIPTAEFRSPYPWVEVARRDGVRGSFVYAPVDQVPADWPHWNLINQHTRGFWQFVLTSRQPVPEDARFDCQGGAIWDGSGNLDIASFRRAIELMTTPDQSGPPDFTLTPAGQAALAQIP
jgi:hypothetical protein